MNSNGNNHAEGLTCLSILQRFFYLGVRCSENVKIAPNQTFYKFLKLMLLPLVASCSFSSLSGPGNKVDVSVAINFCFSFVKGRSHINEI